MDRRILFKNCTLINFKTRALQTGYFILMRVVRIWVWLMH